MSVTLQTLSDANDFLDALRRIPGVDSSLKHISFAGRASLSQLTARSPALEKQLSSLLDDLGWSATSDDAERIAVQLTDLGLHLMAAAASNNTHEAARFLDEKASRLVDCAQGLQDLRAAFDAGRQEGLNRRGSRPRTR